MIERVVITEFLLYLFPLVLLIGLTYYSYKTKGIYLKEFYRFLYLVPLFTVILSLKFFFVSEFPSEGIFISSIADLGLFIVTALFVLPVLSDLGFGLRSQINKTLMITILPYLSIFWLKNSHSALDLFAYWTISVFIILISSWLYTEDRSLKRLFYISTAIFYLDFSVRFFAYYRNVYFYNFLELSSLIGVTAISLVIFEAFLFIKHQKSSNIPEEVKKVHIPTMQRTIFITFLVSVSLGLFVFYAAGYYNSSVISARKSVKGVLYETGIQLTARSSEFFHRANSLLETLASGYSLKSGNEWLIRSTIQEAYYANKDLFSSLTYMNKDGIIVYTYPYENASGRSIKNQPHVKLILKTHQPVISDPIKTVQGFYSVVIHQPVFEKDRFIGSIAGLIRLSTLNRTLSVYGRKEVGFIVLEGKIVVASSDRNFIFRNFDSIPRDFFAKNIFESDTFAFLNKNFSVDTYLPVSTLSEMKKEIAKKVSLALFVLFTLILSLLYFMLEIIRRGDIEKSEAVKRAILKEKEERKKYQGIYVRLSKVLAFFKNVSFSESEERFLEDILDIAISVMPNGEKGTVALKGEDRCLQFVASNGYDLEKLKKLRIPFEKEENIMKKGDIPVIKKIYKTDKKLLSPEGIKILKDIGNYGIKSTLTAPIYIGDNYIGSIFIDNFRSEEAFNDEDIKVAESISQIASLFVEGREYVKEMKHNFIVSSVVSSIISLFGKEKRRRNPARLTLPVLRNLISSDITLFVVCIKSLSGYVMYCATPASSDSLYFEAGTVRLRNSCTVSPEFVKKWLLKNMPRCASANIKSIYATSAKEAGFFSFFGFDVEKIPNDVKTILEKLTSGLQYIFTNIELLRQVSEAHVETLVTMVKTIEAKDPYTKNHSERVTVYSYLIGKKYGLNKSRMRVLYYSALLHDIGKIGVPDRILKKQGKLSGEEYEQIKKHPEFGAEIIGNIKFLEETSNIILYHHERWDGGGYPSGLKGENIPLLSRIIAIADTFDAITSNRSYRKARSFEEALTIIFKERGRQFDPEVVDLFLSISRETLMRYRDNPDILKIYNDLFD